MQKLQKPIAKSMIDEDLFNELTMKDLILKGDCDLYGAVTLDGDLVTRAQVREIKRREKNADYAEQNRAVGISPKSVQRHVE